MSSAATTEFASESHPDRSVGRERRLFPLLICIFGAITYAAVPAFGFVYDDLTQILRNPTLLHLSSIPQYFLHHVWSYVPGMPASYYRPLFSVWLNVNYALFGNQPAGWHVAGLFLHLLASVLAYRVAWTVFRDQEAGLLAGMLFAVHPVHVESIAWIGGQTEPLAASFLLASFLTYLSSREHEGWRRWALLAGSLSMFAGSLLTKETALLFPILLLLEPAVLAGNGRSWWARAKFVPFYFVVDALYLLARIRVLGHFGQTHVALMTSGLSYTLPSVLLFYLRLMFFPVGLSAYYDTPYIQHPSFVQFWLPAFAVAGVLALLVLATRWLTSKGEVEANSDRRACIFFLLWAAMFLVPALNLRVLDPGEIAHDRYLYLPSVGLLAVIAFLLDKAAMRLHVPARTRAIAAALLAVSLSAMAAAQSFYWKNDLALYRRGYLIAPSNFNALNNLATAYLDNGAIDEGIALHKQILAKFPGNASSYYNIGLAYYNQQDFRSAEKYIGQALSLQPQANWYFYLGMAQFKNGHAADAEKSLLKATRAGPDQPDFHAALGAIYELQNRMPEALEQFEEAKRLGSANATVDGEIERIKRQR